VALQDGEGVGRQTELGAEAIGLEYAAVWNGKLVLGLVEAYVDLLVGVLPVFIVEQ